MTAPRVAQNGVDFWLLALESKAINIDKLHPS